VGVVLGPPSASFLDASLEYVTVAAFDQAGAYGQIEGQSAGIVELVGAIAQIA
jgi:hypothetical protein